MQNNRVLRTIVATVVVLLLLLPSFITAIVWTTVNLYVAVLAISALAVVAYLLPRFKWLFAAVTAGLIALPPYPNWLFWNESRGWFFTVGPNLQEFSIGFSVLCAVIVLALVRVLFWAIGKPVKDERVTNEQK